MSVTKLEVILSALLVLIVCEAGYYLPGFLASYVQGPDVHPAPSSTPAKVIADVRPPTYSQPARVQPTIRLSQRESRKVETMLQDPTPAEDIRVEELGEATIPLVFVDPPDGLLTSQEQVAAFDTLRQEFAESLSAFAQDPSTPEYRRRWEEAQQTFDEEFGILFGVEAYNQQQNTVMRAAMQP
jgi:hypothetical protein